VSDAVPIIAVVLGCLNILIGIGTLFTLGRAWGRMEAELRHLAADLAETKTWVTAIESKGNDTSNKVARLEGAQEANA